MEPELRRRAGHYEVLGETYAKFEFFQKGWNPYSRFLDVDKVDLILRRSGKGAPIYREVQVKFGKLYRVGQAWERQLFDVTSWRFFKEGEFDKANPALFIAYVMSEDDEYRGDFFIFPVRDFASIVREAPIAGGKRRVYISRCKDEPKRWVLRRKTRFDRLTDETSLDVSGYRRNFGAPNTRLQLPGARAGLGIEWLEGSMTRSLARRCAWWASAPTTEAQSRQTAGLGSDAATSGPHCVV